MIFFKRIIASLLFVVFTSHFSTCQENDTNWSSREKKMYQNLKGLAYYVDGKDVSEVSRDSIFKNYIEMDYVLNDTSETRKKNRLDKFTGFFTLIHKTVDSIGFENLDAKPIRFYKNHPIYQPFEESLKHIEPYVFVYYRKETPDKPLGTLLFDSKTNKLFAWILLKQGESGWFYLSLNLL